MGLALALSRMTNVIRISRCVMSFCELTVLLIGVTLSVCNLLGCK